MQRVEFLPMGGKFLSKKSKILENTSKNKETINSISKKKFQIKHERLNLMLIFIEFKTASQSRFQNFSIVRIWDSHRRYW